MFFYSFYVFLAVFDLSGAVNHGKLFNTNIFYRWGKDLGVTLPYCLLLLSTVANIEVCIHACISKIQFWMLSFLTYLHTGKLAKGAVLKAICAGFEETTEPAVCLSGGKFFLSYIFLPEKYFSLLPRRGHHIVHCSLELPREN